MKRVLLLLLLTPSLVFASSLECENGNYKLNDGFKCILKSSTDKTYESISGTIITPEHVACDSINYDSGLNEIEKYENNKFNLKGTALSENYVTFNCRIAKDVTTLTKEKLVINDFTYDGITEIVKSDDINIISSAISKPKNTSKNSLLINDITDEKISFVFSKYITDYNIEVLNDVESFNPVVTLASSTSTYEISNTNLNVGENVIDIFVTDENGDKNTYTFNIKRLDVGETKYVKESDSTVKNIEVIGQKFNFNIKKKSYTLEVSGNVTKLDINVIPNYDKAIVNISGNNNLKNKSRIVVKVTSEDGTSESKYYITIKKKFDLAENMNLIVTIIVSILVVALIVVILITNNKKNKNETTDNINK